MLKSLPPLGLRNLKTALSVLICLLLFLALGRENASFACVAAVVSMGDNTENSLRFGWERILSTLIGGAIGLLVYFLDGFLIFPGATTLISAVGIIPTIYICVLIRKPQCVQIACLVFLMMIVGTHAGLSTETYLYKRFIDTVLGVFVGTAVNVLIRPRKRRAVRPEDAPTDAAFPAVPGEV